MTTNYTEQRQQINEALAELRTHEPASSAAWEAGERADRLAQTLHGDPRVGAPAWAVESRDDTGPVEPDTRIVTHTGPLSLVPGQTAEPVAVQLEECVTYEVDGRVERELGAYLQTSGTISRAALRPLAAALLDAADTLDSADGAR